MGMTNNANHLVNVDMAELGRNQVRPFYLIILSVPGVYKRISIQNQ